ncbi:hypothetical protein Athai_24030 [Actinocatenispora thailandica]|uniref:Uncharacterized protein n=1 Tax=Actinocatenispora thailandica TaxID=227318 RepID=A0A7R7DNB8_9ACTN|nr:hypothetical protein [Actinocatenispora thailandica]BCJ34900.1 hypothetical protein Athai_24030 [Actinocatenispora thailandica]
MAETREQRLRRLGRLRRAFRRWVVLGAGLTGAAAVLTPYAGVGLPDAAWAAGAGVSVALAVFRWRDYRALAAVPLPPERPQVGAGEAVRQAMRSALAANPLARAAVDEVSRRAERRKYGDTAAAAPMARLTTAMHTLDDVRAGTRTQFIDEALAEAADGERALRDLAHRLLTVEKASRFAGPAEAPTLASARQTLSGQLADGVATYERLAAATAAAAASGVGVETGAQHRLTEAADRMAAFAAGLAELREPAS